MESLLSRTKLKRKAVNTMALDIHLAKDKTTKNTVRFGEQPDDADSHPVELYLSKERWEKLGRPEDLSLKIDSM